MKKKLNEKLNKKLVNKDLNKKLTKPNEKLELKPYQSGGVGGGHGQSWLVEGHRATQGAHGDAGVVLQVQGQRGETV